MQLYSMLIVLCATIVLTQQATLLSYTFLPAAVHYLNIVFHHVPLPSPGAGKRRVRRRVLPPLRYQRRRQYYTRGIRPGPAQTEHILLNPQLPVPAARADSEV